MGRLSLMLTVAILAGVVIWIAKNVWPFQSVTYAPVRPSAEQQSEAPEREGVTSVERVKIPAVDGSPEARHAGKSPQALRAEHRNATARFNRERNRLVERYLEEGKYVSDLQSNPNYPSGPPAPMDLSKPLIVVGRPNYDTPGQIEYRQVFLDRSQHETLDELWIEMDWLRARVESLEDRPE